MCNGSSHCQNHAEAVEHGHLYHHAVCGGQVHAVADSLTVVYYIIMCKHYALGEACSSRGVLHICNIVDINGLSYALYLTVGNVLGKLNSLLPCVAAVVLGINSDNVLEVRKFCGVELTGLAGVKLGAELLDDINIVDVLDTVDHNECHGIGLSQQILSLVDTVLCIHCYEYSAYLGSSPEGYIPLGNICSPDSNMIALLYAHCKE